VTGLVLLVWALASSGGDEPATAPRVIQVGLGDYFIDGDLTVEAGDVELQATNIGVEPHNVGIVGGKITTHLFSGQSATLDLGELAPGTYRLFCDVDDHMMRGMVATLTVTEPAPKATLKS
jgi:plastocyanin